MVRMLYAACRDVAPPVVQGTEVGRWIADDPIIALTRPTGLCVSWGLHRLWTVRCQKAVHRMEVGTPSVGPGFTFKALFLTTQPAIRRLCNTCECAACQRWQGSGSNGGTAVVDSGTDITLAPTPSVCSLFEVLGMGIRSRA